MRALVVPSEVEEPRGVTEKLNPRDPSTPLRFAQDDGCCEQTLSIKSGTH